MDHNERLLACNCQGVRIWDRALQPTLSLELDESEHVFVNILFSNIFIIVMENNEMLKRSALKSLTVFPYLIAYV